jgi:hypothetical protein
MRTQTVDGIKGGDVHCRAFGRLPSTTIPLLIPTATLFLFFFLTNVNVLNDETILQDCEVT